MTSVKYLEENFFQNSPNIIDFKILIEALPAAVIIFDKDLRFIAASDRFFEESPLNKCDVNIHDHWYSLVPDMPSKWKLIHQRCLHGEHLKCEEDPFHREDGTVEWWKWEILPWKINNIVGGLILYVENITTLKETEITLRTTLHSLNRSNKDLKRFAQHCAHDLNAPLRTISNYVQIIQNESRYCRDTELKKYINAITDNIAYMTDLISNVLESAQTQHEKTKLEHIPFKEIVECAVSILTEMINACHATIHYDELPTVYGDRTFLVQVIQNLISNALKYKNNNDPLIHIGFLESRLYWIIFIQDNGIGIEKKNLRKIFKENNRISHLDCEGYGVGLHQCRKIIHKHGGKIWVKSRLSEGSTFYFTLPKVP